MLSATLIARDEERFLPDCLHSIREVVDEIVVVDTGSRDSTRDIAASFEARVFSFEWCDDFSAARNFAIDQARGDWLLYIDADERVRSPPQASLTTELAAPELVCATVRFRPRTGFTAYREHRLIRRDPRIRFHGAMHETFLRDVECLVESGAGAIGASSLAIDHVGYDGNQSHKYDRNMRLLLKQIAADPHRSYLWWHLGTLHRDAGREADAERAWQEGARIAREQPRTGPGAALCAIELAKLRVARGEDPEALLEEAEAVRPGNLMLHWLRGKSLLARGDYDAAEPIFTALAAIDAETLIDEVSYDERLFGPFAWAELGDAAFRFGRFADSLTCYANAERMAPRCAEFRVKRQLAAARG